MSISDEQMIGQYRVLEPLGQGGMATVYKAYHPRLDRIVAIKVIHMQFLDDPHFVARFEREAQIVAKLDHPNIVPVYDYAEFSGVPYIVMKYVEGTNLKSVLAEGTLDIPDALHVMSSIVSALDYAHGRGVLHRDVKPSNIMLDTEAVPYLADFGLARLAVGGATTLSADMLIGTPYYMSPEQARGDEEIDGRADVYSLGIVLYELLTGNVPYRGATPYSVIHMQINTALPPPRTVNPNIPPAVEAVLLKALAKARDERYASAGEMFAAFRDAIGANAGNIAMPAPPGAQPLRQSIVVASHAQRMSAKPATSRPIDHDDESAETSSLHAPAAPIASAASNGRRTSASIPPSAAIPANGDVNTITQPRPPARRGGLLWWIIGGAALILIALLALGAINRARRAAEDALLPTAAVLPTSAVLVPGNTSSALTVTLLDVPELSLDAASANLRAHPDDPIAALALFRAQIAAGSTDNAGQVLRDGMRYADNAAIYLLTAAALAEDLDSPGVAVVILRDGLTELVNDASYPLFREEAGRSLYDAALLPGNGDLFDVRALRDVSQETLRATSPIYNAISARALLSRDLTRLAQSLATVALERSPGLPEAELVRGELLASEGRAADAQALWQMLIDSETAPDWVKTRATALLEQGG